ncbi:MAG: hypothetical protein HYS81_04755 [Candidatus Aenigmatarchaeota archaeon]|nr:MAG: hypothetical protein HYS81_04755 [Candidatus Aenigmarchaeota archaeon]
MTKSYANRRLSIKEIKEIVKEHGKFVTKESSVEGALPIVRVAGAWYALMGGSMKTKSMRLGAEIRYDEKTRDYNFRSRDGRPYVSFDEMGGLLTLLGPEIMVEENAINSLRIGAKEYFFTGDVPGRKCLFVDEDPASARALAKNLDIPEAQAARVLEWMTTRDPAEIAQHVGMSEKDVVASLEKLRAIKRVKRRSDEKKFDPAFQ